MDKTSLVLADLSGADISEVKMKDVNTSRWVIESIKCTHIFRDDKRIDYAEGEFEKAHTQIERLAEMIINAPLSDLTYYTGYIIQECVNEEYGEGSLVLKTQTALSNDSTKFEFMSFQDGEKLDEIIAKMSEIEKKTNHIYKETIAKQETKDIITVTEKIPLGPLPIGISTIAVKNVLIERFNRMDPLLQRIIVAVQSCF